MFKRGACEVGAALSQRFGEGNAGRALLELMPQRTYEFYQH